MGRSFMPDKVAAHMEYTEKIGGSMVGVGAGIQSGKKIATRIMKMRKAKAAKRNNTAQENTEQPRQSNVRQKARDAEGDATEQEETRTTGQTDSLRQEAEDPFKDAREVGQRGDAGFRGEVQDESEQKQLREGGGEDTAEQLEGGGARAETEVSTEAPASDIGTSIRRGGGSVLGEDAPLSAEQQTSFDRMTSQKPITGEPIEEGLSGKPKATFADDEDLLTGGGEEAEQGILSRVGSAVGDAAKAVGRKVAGGIGDTIAEAGVADAVPFVGELVGLGMLIHGIVKAHKHEENSGGPQLSAANQEATEQSGGFSSDMLKGMSGAPTIV